MTNLPDQLLRKPKHLLRNPRDKPQPQYQTLHFFLPDHLHAQFLREAVIVHVRPAAGDHDFDGGLHALDRDAVGGCRGVDEVDEPPDEIVDVGRFEPGEIEEAAREGLG